MKPNKTSTRLSADIRLSDVLAASDVLSDSLRRIDPAAALDLPDLDGFSDIPVLDESHFAAFPLATGAARLEQGSRQNRRNESPAEGTAYLQNVMASAAGESAALTLTSFVQTALEQSALARVLSQTETAGAGVNGAGAGHETADGLQTVGSGRAVSDLSPYQTARAIRRESEAMLRL